MTGETQRGELPRIVVDPRTASDADILRLASDGATLEARFARLERAIADQNAAADQRIAFLTDAIVGLREALRPGEPPALAAAPVKEGGAANDRIAALQAELAAREQMLAEVEAASRKRIAILSEALSEIHESITWRATAPLRKAGSRLPEPVRRRSRELARRAFWALSPHRMPMRRQWIAYAPQTELIVKRLAALSEEVHGRLKPLRLRYGPTAIEQLDIYPATRPNAPVFVFIHGGAWRAAEARDAAFAAETFVNAGAHYVALDFIGIEEAGGDLRVVADQVRRGVAWVYRNAESFGGDRERLYLGGHSSGGHLCAVTLVTDWQTDFGLPADLAKGGVLMSGFYELKPVRLAKRAPLVKFTDEMEHAMSPLHHIEGLHVPLVLTYGGSEAPEFGRQARDFHAAVRAAGKAAELIEAAHYGHMEMAESLGSPYGVNGRAVLGVMQLSPTPPR